MKMSKSGVVLGAIAAAGLWAGTANAQTALDGDLLRIDASYNIQSTALDDGFDEVNILESGLVGTITYQSNTGLYGRLGLGRISIDEIEINGFTFDVNESYSLRGFGLGYRTPRAGGNGLYWGVGYSNTDIDEPGSDPSHSFQIFWEKEWTNRYGIISVAYTTDDNLDLFSISGRHVWFGASGVGIGVAWGLGTGQMGDFSPKIDVGQAMVGAILMFRPGM